MKRFNKILCVVDPEKNAESAIIQSLRIANDHQAEITFVSVISEPIMTQKHLLNSEELSADVAEIPEKLQFSIKNKILTIDSTFKPEIEVVLGIGFIEIIKKVMNSGYDLVIKCAEDTDWLDRLFGSEDMHLLRKCPCPVLMLKPNQNDIFRNILATIDVNDDLSELDSERIQEQLNREVLQYSATLCMPELTDLHIGSAWEFYAEDFLRFGAFSSLPDEKVNRIVDQQRNECTSKINFLVKDMDVLLGKEAMQYLQPKIHLIKGKPAKEIPLMAEKYSIDLIVMGTVGRIGIPGFIIGNTAESILEQTRCSVLAIKPAGFKSPVV